VKGSHCVRLGAPILTVVELALCRYDGCDCRCTSLSARNFQRERQTRLDIENRRKAAVTMWHERASTKSGISKIVEDNDTGDRAPIADRGFELPLCL
jgi:hypothetical protein